MLKFKKKDEGGCLVCQFWDAVIPQGGGGGFTWLKLHSLSFEFFIYFFGVAAVLTYFSGAQSSSLKVAAEFGPAVGFSAAIKPLGSRLSSECINIF